MVPLIKVKMLTEIEKRLEYAAAAYKFENYFEQVGKTHKEL